jgi:hypothetical protein
VGFEPTIPAFERAKTVHALDSAVTVIATNVIRVVKYRMMKWTEYAARTKETRILCKLSVGKSQGNKSVGMQYEYGKTALELPHQWRLHLIVVVGFECSRDPESYAGGSVATGRSTHAGQVKG